MKSFGGAVVAVLGIGSLLLGLLFVAGADGQPRRVLIGAVCLVLGALASGMGIRIFKLAVLESPEQLRIEVLELARERNGEISAVDVRAGLGRRGRLGLLELDVMVGEDICGRTSKKGQTYFVFPDLQPRLMARYCQYCDAEYPMNDDNEDCPNCGGTLEMRVAVRSVSDGAVFSMDQ